MTRALIIAACLLTAQPAGAGDAPDQFGQILKRAQQFKDIEMTDAEEQQLGEGVSLKIRTRYGVVQDQAVHKYVSLVGTALALGSTRPTLAWKFIVLDTDGVNAFAAPGGYVHITRGALGLLQDESELADVLAHEIIHVTEKHTIRAIQKGKMVQMGATESLANNPVLLTQLVDKSTELVLAGFGRAEEMESDEKGLALSSKIGYAPQGLGNFLTRLTERNKASTEKQGLFASHPEMKERLQKNTKLIADKKLVGAATLAERYRKFISYQAPAQSEVAQVEAGAAGLTGGGDASAAKPKEGAKEGEKPPEEKKRGFGLSGLVKPGGGEKKSAEVTGSGASRGVDTERNAKGGAVATPVTVAVTAAELAAFKKEGGLT
jgi:beta-barrel assembly-enhancing protease